MKHMRYGAWVIPIIFSLVLLNGCGGGSASQQQLLNTMAIVDEVPLDVPVKNGYLVFSDQASFDAALKQLAAKNQLERAQWGAHLPGFTSLRADYDQTADRIALLAQELELKQGDPEKIRAEGEKQLERILAEHQHSTYEAIGQDGSSSFRENISRIVEASLVNKLGLVQIGDQLWHYSAKYIKLAPDSVAEELLLKSQKSNDELGIKVISTNTEVELSRKIVPADGEGQCPECGPSVRADEITIKALKLTVDEGGVADFEVTVPKLPSESRLYPIYIDDHAIARVNIAKISMNNGVQFYPKDVNHPNEDLIYVPADNSKFTLNLPILKNDSYGDNMSFKIHVKAPVSGVTYDSGTVWVQDISQPPSTGGGYLPDQKIQQQNDGHKFIVARNLYYTWDNGEHLGSTTYTVHMRSERAGKWPRKNSWIKEKANMSYDMRIASRDFDSGPIHYDTYTDERENQYYYRYDLKGKADRKHWGYIRAKNDYIDLIEILE